MLRAAAFVRRSLMACCVRRLSWGVSSGCVPPNLSLPVGNSLTSVKPLSPDGPYCLPMIDPALLAALRRNPLLSGLGAAEHAVLAAVGNTVRLPGGSVLYERGEDARRLFLVVDGAVALDVPDETG